MPYTVRQAWVYYLYNKRISKNNKDGATRCQHVKLDHDVGKIRLKKGLEIRFYRLCASHIVIFKVILTYESQVLSKI